MGRSAGASLVLVFAIFLSAIAATGIAHGASTAAMGLADCDGRSSPEPHDVVLICKDASLVVHDLTWTGWGGRFAAGIGVADVNDCKPACASAHVRHAKIVLIASGSQKCVGGGTAYETIDYAFIGPSPYSEDAPETANPRLSFSCRVVKGTL